VRQSSHCSHSPLELETVPDVNDDEDHRHENGVESFRFQLFSNPGADLLDKRKPLGIGFELHRDTAVILQSIVDKFLVYLRCSNYKCTGSVSFVIHEFLNLDILKAVFNEGSLQFSSRGGGIADDIRLKTAREVNRKIKSSVYDKSTGSDKDYRCGDHVCFLPDIHEREMFVTKN